jgi:hypothetical protein
MAANYDPRIASAFAALGYDVFPFSAFDSAGRPIVPDDLKIPSHYTEATGRIATTPVWSEIYKAVSVLDDPGWNCYMAGLAFVGNDVRVVIFKALSTVKSAEEANQWSRSYESTVEQTISEYAGRSHIVDPAWVATLNEMIGVLPAENKQGDPKAGQGQAQVPGSADPAGSRPGGGTPADGAVTAVAKDPSAMPANAASSEALGVAPWLLLALRAMSSVLTNLTKRTYVRTTVFWYTTGTMEVDMAWASNWTPLHRLYADSKKRTVHGVWRAAGPKRGLPAIIYGVDPAWRGPGVPDMPHDPWQWCRAFYPTAPCEGPDRPAVEQGPIAIKGEIARRVASQ